jgi:cysteine synthase
MTIIEIAPPTGASFDLEHRGRHEYSARAHPRHYRAHGWFRARQFENEANADIHSRTTAPEILEAFGDRRLDFGITGHRKGGTLKGVARVLRACSRHTQIVVAEPNNSQVLGTSRSTIRRRC